MDHHDRTQIFYFNQEISSKKTPETLAKILSLIQENETLLSETYETNTAIQLAASLKLWNVIGTIALNQKTNSKDTYHYGSALISALADNQPDSNKAATALVNAGSSLSWQFLETGNQALHLAVLNRDKAMVKLLIGKGIDLACKNKKGNTPIQVAADNRFADKQIPLWKYLILPEELYK